VKASTAAAAFLKPRKRARLAAAVQIIFKNQFSSKEM